MQVSDYLLHIVSRLENVKKLNDTVNISLNPALQTMNLTEVNVSKRIPPGQQPTTRNVAIAFNPDAIHIQITMRATGFGIPINQAPEILTANSTNPVSITSSVQQICDFLYPTT